MRVIAIFAVAISLVLIATAIGFGLLALISVIGEML